MVGSGRTSGGGAAEVSAELLTLDEEAIEIDSSTVAIDSTLGVGST